MTYAECVRTALLHQQGWGTFLFALVVGVGLAKFGRWYSAVASLLCGAVLGAILVAAYYELNCVELFPA